MSFSGTSAFFFFLRCSISRKTINRFRRDSTTVISSLCAQRIYLFLNSSRLCVCVCARMCIEAPEMKEALLIFFFLKKFGGGVPSPRVPSPLRRVEDTRKSDRAGEDHSERRVSSPIP